MKGIIMDNSNNILYCNRNQVGQRINGGLCMDLSYVDQYGNISRNTVSIYQNYFKDPNTGMLQKVPYGFIANPNQIGITPQTKINAYDVSVNNLNNPGTQNVYQNYINNLDNIVTYHKDYMDGEIAPDGGGLPTGYMWIKDKDGKLSVSSIFDSSFNNPLYYEPGQYNYGAANYVPTYENSVYLSNLTNYSKIANATLAPSLSIDLGVGFCSTTTDPYTIDSKCSSLDSNICSSMSCCNVLEGGKCVGGSITGPFFSQSTSYIMNRDYYYYQGKCYGSCNK
jgi:hypothetical protein